MSYFPLFINLNKKKCLIIGGGNVAYRKAINLIPFNCDVVVASNKFHENFETLNNITLENRHYSSFNFDDFFLIIAATNNEKINSDICKLANEKNIFVNSVTSAQESSFLFPSLYKEKSVTIGITTSGKSPLLSKHIRQEIEKTLPHYIGDISDILGDFRELVKSYFPLQKQRSDVFKILLETLLKTKNNISKKELEEIVRGIYENKSGN